MRLLASQPVSIAKILDTSIKLYAASFNKLIGFFLIMAAFYISTGLISQQLVNNQTANTPDAQAAMLANLPFLLGFLLVFTLLSFVFYIAMVYRIDNVANEREDSFMEALQVGFKKFPSMMLAAFLYSIAMTVGLILLVVPGIILSLSLAFYLYFIVVDSLSGYAALKASHSLVWGNWWRTMTVFMAPAILVFVAVFGIGLLVGILGALLKDPMFASVLTIFENVVSAFITPYFFTLGYVQFNDLKLRKFGSDLAGRLSLEK
jgi:hypothetical protein